MMRIVADTNILVSGLLWGGAPSRLIRLAVLGHIEFWASTATVQEFERVLGYARLQPRMRALNVERDDMLATARAVLNIVPAPPIQPVITADPKDDIFLACALAAGAQYLVSGDSHLLDLGQWRGIEMVTVNDFLAQHFPEDTTQ
jgi:putative PIN family toxin of toxin-antitoxin system